MDQPVGYFLRHPEYQMNVPGVCYNYHFAANGVFIEAENPLIYALVPIAFCHIRGVQPMGPEVRLKNGRVPGSLFDLSVNTAIAQVDREFYFAVTWPGDGKYHLMLTHQAGIEGKVDYYTQDNTVLEIHSHGRLAAAFSSIDDQDEQGLRAACVIGCLDREPQVAVRLGVYGYQFEVDWSMVFEGELTSAKRYQEVIPEEVRLELPG